MTEPIQQDHRFEQKVAALEDYYNLGNLKTGEYRQLRSVVEKPAEVLDSTERTINSLLEDLLNRTIDFDYFYNSYKLLSPRLPAPPTIDSAPAVHPDDVEVSPRRRLATPIPPKAIATGAVALILLLIIAYFFLKPSAPGKLAVVSVSSRHVGLAWEDQSNIERGFTLERNDGGNTKFVTIATPPEDVTAYVDSTVQPLTTYAYRLRAYNRMGFSRFSNHTITFTAAPSSPPSSPAQLRANPASASQIDLYWIDSSNDENSFVIERSPSMTSNFAEVTAVAANVTIYRDRGLTPATQYYYRVSAKNAAGASLPTSVINARTYPAPDRAPETPTGVHVINATPAQVVLQWHDASLNEEEFQIERRALTDSIFSRIASEGAGIFRFVDTGVSPDTRYFYRVRAVNRAGVSP